MRTMASKTKEMELMDDIMRQMNTKLTEKDTGINLSNKDKQTREIDGIRTSKMGAGRTDALAELAKKAELEGGMAQLSQVKEDVVHLSNPHPYWQFGKVLSISARGETQDSLILSLQRNQAIAVMLDKATNMTPGVQVDTKLNESYELSLEWGHPQTALGKPFE